LIANALQEPHQHVLWTRRHLAEVGAFELHPNLGCLCRCSEKFLENGYFRLLNRWVIERKIRALTVKGFMPIFELDTLEIN
jgi:hypothetical protein